MYNDDLDGLVARMVRHGDIDEDSLISPDQVTIIVTGVCGRINAALSVGGYAPIPPTEPDWFLEYLAAVEAWGSCAEILRSRFVDGGGPNREGSVTFYEDRFTKALEELRTGAAGLPVSEAGATGLPESLWTSEVITDDAVLKVGMKL